MIIPNKKARIGKRIQIDVMYRITTIFPRRKNKNTKKLANTFGKFVSTEFKSLESLLRILPSGTLSKNSLRGENRRLLIIDS